MNHAHISNTAVLGKTDMGKTNNYPLWAWAPEPTSLARTRGFNRPQVELFYKHYWDLVERHNVDATTIYNMDETGVKSSTTKPPKVSIKGKRPVGVVSSAERGQLTTVLNCCCNAADWICNLSFLPLRHIRFARPLRAKRLIDTFFWNWFF